MQISSFQEDLTFNEHRVSTKVILESPFSKEIRITMNEGQMMKEHKTPYPIVVHVLDGEIDFGVNGTQYALKKGSVITLEGGVPHDLLAKQNSVVRLTLSKLDKIERVEKLVLDLDF